MYSYGIYMSQNVCFFFFLVVFLHKSLIFLGHRCK